MGYASRDTILRIVILKSVRELYARVVGIEALNKQLAERADYTAKLEKQIRDLQIQIQLTRRQKRNTDAIIYSIRDAVIVVDEFDRLLMANEAAEIGRAHV